MLLNITILFSSQFMYNIYTYIYIIHNYHYAVYTYALKLININKIVCVL